MASFRNFLGLPVKLWDSRAAGQVLQLSSDKEHWEFGMDGAGAADAALASANAYTDAGLAGKEPTITAGTAAQYWRGDKTWQPLNASAVGLGNANNTSDASKPVSDAQAEADSLRVLKAGDFMTGPLGLPSDPTSSLQAATKQYTDKRATNPSPVVVTASAEVFLTASGGETSAPLTIGGVALAGTPTVTAIHRTDWQGRLALSSSARTNYCLQSSAIGSSPWVATATGTGSAPVITGNYANAPDGILTATRIQCQRTSSSGASFVTQAIPVTPSTQPRRVSVWAQSTDGTTQTIQVGVAGTGIQTVSVGSVPVRITATYTPASSFPNINPYIGLFSGASPALTCDVLVWGCESALDTSPGVYIPTTTAAVTVTDYTLSGSTASLGQAASAGAVYDWDGSGTPRYPASFAGPVTVGQYLKAALPSVSTYTYALIVVTDATGGPALCLSNGTNWINLTTGSVVS